MSGLEVIIAVVLFTATMEKLDSTRCPEEHRVFVGCPTDTEEK